LLLVNPLKSSRKVFDCFDIPSWRKQAIKATGEIGGIVIGKTERAGGGFGGRAQDLPVREIRRSKNDIFLTGGSTEVKRERLATRRGCRNYQRRGRLPDEAEVSA